MVYLKPLEDSFPPRNKLAPKPDREQNAGTPTLDPGDMPPAAISSNPELTIDDRFAARLAFDTVPTARLGLDDFLKANERAAANAFDEAARSIPAPVLPVEFTRKLERWIIPQLAQIGMNPRLALEFFRLAGSAWEQMSPYLEKSIAFHPRLYQDIETIREDIRAAAEDNPQEEFGAQETDPGEKRQEINSTMAPENLKGLFGLVATPWIILPRAYNGLKRNQHYYLPIYLQFIGRNSDTACNRVFTRIVIEMVANYSAKFAHRRYSPVILKNVLFHAYEEMFWRTLRNPPSGFEDCNINEAIFNLFIRHARLGDPMSTPMAKAVSRVKTAQAYVFPPFLHRDHQLAPARFLVTLRHGPAQIEILLKYFDHKLKMDRIAQGHPSGSVTLLKATTGLIREVGKKYSQENQFTQLNIRRFFYRLRKVVAGHLDIKGKPTLSKWESARFSFFRIVQMIDDMLLKLS